MRLQPGRVLVPSVEGPATAPASGHDVAGLLLLETLPGVVDALAEELRQLPAETTIVRRWPSAILIEYAGPIGPLVALPLYSTCSLWTGGRADASDIASVVTQSMRAAASPRWRARSETPEDPVRFRVGDVGQSRWAIRDALVEEGMLNSPGEWELNIDIFGQMVVITIGAMHTARRFGELKRLPASTNPVLAAALVRLAKIRPGDVVLDPFCGAGTNLVAAADRRIEDVTLLGLDAKLSAAQICLDNLRARSVMAFVAQARAERLPLSELSVDRLVSNIPFGKRVGSHDNNTTLYPAFAREIGRVLRNSGRAVLLTEEKRLLVDAIQRTRGLKIIRESVVEIGGLHPSAFVIERSRRVKARPASRHA